MEDKMNTAVIGCGMISDTYLQSLKQFSILQIDSCCDLNEDRAAAMAGKFGIRARTLDDILEDKNIELISYEIKNDSMILNFNNSIFMDKDSILEEVVYSISYSVFSSYDNVQEVVFKVGEKEICKKSVKNVE